MRASALVLLLAAADAWAIDLENMADLKVAVAGVSSDGSAYAVRASWRFWGDDASRCGYPDSPELKRPDGVALVLCHTGGSCEAPQWVYRLPRAGVALDERLFSDGAAALAATKLDLTLCTDAASATKQLEAAKESMRKAGIELERHGEKLSRGRDATNLGMLVLPAGTLAEWGIAGAVTLSHQSVAVRRGEAAYDDWLYAQLEQGKAVPVRKVKLFRTPYNGTPVSLEAGFLLSESKRVLVFASASMVAEGLVSELDRIKAFDGAPWELSLEEVARPLLEDGLQLTLEWSNHLSSSSGWTLISGGSKGATVFTVTFSFLIHAPGQASLASLDEKAIATLFGELDALGWKKLKNGNSCAMDSSQGSARIIRGGKINFFSFDSGCHDRQNQVRAVVERAVAAAPRETPEPTPQRELAADAGRKGLRVWPQAVTLASGELCRWVAPNWSCSGSGSLEGLARVGDAWFGLTGRKLSDGSLQDAPAVPVVLQTVWW